jgi:hypothetical protein
VLLLLLMCLHQFSSIADHGSRHSGNPAGHNGAEYSHSTSVLKVSSCCTCMVQMRLQQCWRGPYSGLSALLLAAFHMQQLH